MTNRTAPVDRSMMGLRDALFDALDDLRAGRIDKSQAMAVTATAATIIKSVDTQLAYERARLESKIPANLTELPLNRRLPRRATVDTEDHREG